MNDQVKRVFLTTDQLEEMVKGWGPGRYHQYWANKFEAPLSNIRNWVKDLRKENPEWCEGGPTTGSRRSRKSLIEELRGRMSAQVSY